jgi:hypothetical protein
MEQTEATNSQGSTSEIFPVYTNRFSCGCKPHEHNGGHKPDCPSEAIRKTSIQIGQLSMWMIIAIAILALVCSFC